MKRLSRSSAADRAEDARAARLAVALEHDGSVLVEADVGAVGRRVCFLTRTTTAFTTSPFLTLPPGIAS